MHARIHEVRCHAWHSKKLLLQTWQIWMTYSTENRKQRNWVNLQFQCGYSSTLKLGVRVWSFGCCKLDLSFLRCLHDWLLHTSTLVAACSDLNAADIKAVWALTYSPYRAVEVSFTERCMIALCEPTFRKLQEIITTKVLCVCLFK